MILVFIVVFSITARMLRRLLVPDMGMQHPGFGTVPQRRQQRVDVDAGHVKRNMALSSHVMRMKAAKLGHYYYISLLL